ncbi:MAG: N-acetylmuramoyl-L-alanine amidase family protein [Janthinobacterium lividum]
MAQPLILSRRLMLAAFAGLPLPALAQPRRPAPVPAVAPAPAARPPLPLVMLDPGHGGKDPGAIGVSGTYEKHVSLAAAQELRRQLEASGKCRVALTRGRDVFIPLADRVGFAQRQGASLFVSMHADALSDSSVRGASVYTMADTASDPQTAALAQRENSVDRFGAGFRDMPPDVAHILSSLVRQETRQGSARVARTMVGSMTSQIGLIANPARHARFAVLKATDVPSILVEMGFMSNRADEAALRRPEHRARVAGVMRQAIETYLAAGNRAVRVAAG